MKTFSSPKIILLSEVQPLKSPVFTSDYCATTVATTVRLLCDYCVNTARIRRATVFNGKTQWPSTADTLRCNMDPRREYAPPRVAQTVDGTYFASHACTGQGTATTPMRRSTPDQASFDLFNPAPRISMLASTPARRLAKFFHLDAMRFAAWRNGPHTNIETRGCRGTTLTCGRHHCAA